MNEYSHIDSRFQELINGIIEHIFNVCLLPGVDSDAEFQKGCEIVIKLTSLIQKIPTFPSELLEDRVKQLLEQQLPDAGVINSLPKFQSTMDRMLRESILKITNFTIKETHSLASYTESAMDALAHAETQAKADAQALADALAQADAQAKADTQALADALAQAETQAKADAIVHAEMQAKNNQANLLENVLTKVFPKGIVNWYKNLMGQTFLAQVEDILIYLHDPEHPCNLNKYNKDGWKVLVCSTEDLTFPRRLEREIRRIQRSGLVL